MAALLLARTAQRALQRSARSPILAAPRSRRQCWRPLSTKDEPKEEEEAAAPAPDADEASGQDDLRRKIDELQKQLAELSAQVAGS